MSELDFNLLDEAWIPVLMVDGTARSMGVREVFHEAGAIRDIACELPTLNIAIERLLLAICYRTLDVPDVESWLDLWDRGVPEEPIQEYLDRWHDRFFLFGGRYPFMQAPDLRTAKDTVSSLDKIIADVPNGEPFFTTRNGEAIRNISAAEAALWLLHAQTFDPAGIRSGAVDDPETKGGRGYPIGPSWTGQLGLVILKGETLDETLVLNLVPFERSGLRGPASTGPKGACSWEVDDVETGLRRNYAENPDPDGYSVSRLLTWHSRRVRLIGSRDGVTGVVLTQGDRLNPQNMHLYEPMSLWRYSMPQSKKARIATYMPRKHDPARAFWRALPGALPFTQKVKGADKGQYDMFLQSDILRFHSSEDLRGVATAYPIRFQMEAIGVTYGSNEAVIDDIYHDALALASVLLEPGEGGLGDIVKQSVEDVESVALVIGNLGANISRASGERGDGAGDAARDRAKERFFSLIDDPFRQWLSSIGPSSDPLAERARWSAQLRRIALRTSEELLSRASESAVRGRDVGGSYISVGIAENYFMKKLNEIVPSKRTAQKGMGE